MKKLLFLLMPIFIFSQEIKTEEIKINELINGTLFSNNSKKLTIIIAGSGPTDRNGNQPNMENNSLLMLAQGISQESDVFTFDKRIFAMMKTGNIKEEELKFTDFSNDVVDIINYFKTQKKYKKIIIAGHSEGSTIGLLAMNHADAFISIAGAGKPIDEILKEQINKQMPALNKEVAEIFNELKNEKTVEVKNPNLQMLFRPSVQPYMISWIKINPSELIKNIEKPILIINGTKDIQVSVEDAKLLHQSNPKTQLKIIENMNHVLKKIEKEEDNMASYRSKDFKIHEEILVTVNKFLKELK